MSSIAPSLASNTVRSQLNAGGEFHLAEDVGGQEFTSSLAADRDIASVGLCCPTSMLQCSSLIIYVRRPTEHEQMVFRFVEQSRRRPEELWLVRHHINRLSRIMMCLNGNWGTNSQVSQGDTSIESPSSLASFETARSHLTGSCTSHTISEHRSIQQRLPSPPRLPSLPSLRLRHPLRRSSTIPRRKQARDELPPKMRYRYSISPIRRALTASMSAYKPDKYLTTRLFFAVASPYAMAQLRDIFQVITENEEVLPFSRPATIKCALRAISRPGNLKPLLRVLTRMTRYYLVDLYSRKAAELNRSGSYANAEIISTIIAEMCGDLRRDSLEFEDQVVIFRKELYLSRNWYQIAKCFGVGILLHVPWGRDFEIYDSHIQKIPQGHFSVFLRVLGEKRGRILKEYSQLAFRRFKSLTSFTPSATLRLESVADIETIKKKRFDSDELLELLRPL